MIPVYWHCPNGHILGEVKLANHRHRLFVFRNSLTLPPPPNSQNLGEGREGVGGVSAIAQGTVIFYCSICGAARKWSYADEKPSAKLMDRRDLK